MLRRCSDAKSWSPVPRGAVHLSFILANTHHRGRQGQQHWDKFWSWAITFIYSRGGGVLFFKDKHSPLDLGKERVIFFFSSSSMTLESERIGRRNVRVLFSAREERETNMYFYDCSTVIRARLWTLNSFKISGLQDGRAAIFFNRYGLALKT